MFRHIGMYFNFVVNTLVATAVISIFTGNGWSAFLIALVLIIGWSGITLTPIGTWLIRSQGNLREANEIEHNRIDPIFQIVYQRATEKSPGLPSDIEWFVHEDDSLNAFATGMHTIGLNTGLLEFCRDDEIAAVLAHEFAHIAHRDALATALSLQSNSVAILAKSVIIILIRVVGLGLSVLLRFASEDDLLGTIFDFLAKLAGWFFDIYMSLIFMVCTALSYASCRKQEYDADFYAAEIGFCSPLIEFLSHLPLLTFSLHAEITHMLYGTHPTTEDRIYRLKNFLKSGNNPIL